MSFGKWFVSNGEQPGSRRNTETLLGTGNSFDGLFPTGIYTGCVSGFQRACVADSRREENQQG